MPSALFILLWASTAIACGWTIVRAIRRPVHLTEFPLLVSVMWLYFYVYMAWGAGTTLASYLPTGAFETGQAVALASLVGVIVGWQWGMGQDVPRPAIVALPRRCPAALLWTMALGLTVIGTFAYYRFRDQAEIDWAGSSAYWYLLFHVGFPGIGLCLLAMRCDRSLRTPARWAALVAVIALMMWPHLLNARRGPIFPIAIVLVFVVALTSAQTPSRKLILGGIGIAGAAMLVAVAARPFIFLGGDRMTTGELLAGWQEAAGNLTLEDVGERRILDMADNEYLYHCGMIETVVERGCYQYGTGYLTLLTHWVPHSWWPSKPPLGKGWMCDPVEVMPQTVGWEMTTGASPGGVADMFIQLGWFTPLFWMSIAFLLGRLYRRMAKGKEPRLLLFYVGALCATHWLVSQGVAPAFVPMAIYCAVPAFCFWAVGKLPARGAQDLVLDGSLGAKHG